MKLLTASREYPCVIPGLTGDLDSRFRGNDNIAASGEELLLTQYPRD